MVYTQSGNVHDLPLG